MKTSRILILLTMLVIALAGCTAKPTTPPPSTTTEPKPPPATTAPPAPKPSSTTSPPTDDIEIRPAPIHDVRITTTQSQPPQVTVFIKGGLSDGCTKFNEVRVTERSGTRITITVTIKRPRNAMCTQVYGYFEQDVNLGSDFKSGDTYTIQVNDKTTSFSMP